jgi:hypothetical protein
MFSNRPPAVLRAVVYVLSAALVIGAQRLVAGAAAAILS